jgi:ubiquinol-cytochrome c reductase cytochrome c subunit
VSNEFDAPDGVTAERSQLSEEYGFSHHDKASAAPARQRRTKSGRKGRLRRSFAAAGVLGVALIGMGGAFTMLAGNSGAADTTTSAADVQAGQELYAVSCITCHGANLQGVEGRGPSLLGVGAAAVYFQVSTGRMPASGQGANEISKTAKFDDQQTRQLATYVESLGGGPQIPTGNLRNTDQMSEGGVLFRLNCASCHGATFRGAPLSAGKTVPSLNDASDLQIYTAMLSGPENMPVFSDNQITPDQKAEIVAYVQTLKASNDPGGNGIARLGPVTETIVIFVVGLGAIMIAILWIGAKSQ